MWKQIAKIPVEYQMAEVSPVVVGEANDKTLYRF